MMNVIINEGLVDKDYVENHTVGYDELVQRVAGVPGRAGVADHRHTGRGHRHAGPRVRHEPAGGHPRRGRPRTPYRRRPGGAGHHVAFPPWSGPGATWAAGSSHCPCGPSPSSGTCSSGPTSSGPAPASLNQWLLGPALTGELGSRPAHQGAVRLQLQPGGGGAPPGEDRGRPAAGRPVHRRVRAVPHRHGRLRRHRAAGHHPARAVRHHVLLGPLLHVDQQPGHRAAGRGRAQRRAVPPDLPSGWAWRTTGTASPTRRWPWPSTTGRPRPSRASPSRPLKEKGWARLNLPDPDHYAPYAEGGFPTGVGQVRVQVHPARSRRATSSSPCSGRATTSSSPGGTIDPLPHYIPPVEDIDGTPVSALHALAQGRTPSSTPSTATWPTSAGSRASSRSS